MHCQAFYAGGSSTSGNVILGPKKKKFDVGDVFKVGFENADHTKLWIQAAREAGAEEVAPGAPGGAGGSGGTRWDLFLEYSTLNSLQYYHGRVWYCNWVSGHFKAEASHWEATLRRVLLWVKIIKFLFFTQVCQRKKESTMSRWEFLEEHRPNLRSGILSSKCKVFSAKIFVLKM